MLTLFSFFKLSSEWFSIASSLWLGKSIPPPTSTLCSVSFFLGGDRCNSFAWESHPTDRLHLSIDFKWTSCPFRRLSRLFLDRSYSDLRTRPTGSFPLPKWEFNCSKLDSMLLTNGSKGMWQEVINFPFLCIMWRCFRSQFMQESWNRWLRRNFNFHEYFN